MEGQYDDFASDYEWLFSDPKEYGERQVRDLQPQIDAFDDPLILDCACGTGLLTSALARNGYRVVGTDGSSGMIAKAVHSSALEGLAIEHTVCRWDNLSRKFESIFDIVLCRGNSIGHCQDPGEMIRSLTAMHAVLKPGGLLVLDSRDWETLLSRRTRFTCMSPRERGSVRCTPLYVWNFLDEPDAAVVVEVVLLIEADREMALRSYATTYRPFTVRQLADRMKLAGLADVQIDHPEGAMIYQATGTRGRG